MSPSTRHARLFDFKGDLLLVRFAVSSSVLVPLGSIKLGHVIKHTVEHPVGINNPRVRTLPRRDILRHGIDPAVKVGDVILAELLRVRILGKEHRRPVDRRRRQPHKVPRARLVQLLGQTLVDVHDLGVERRRGIGAVPVRVADIVNTDPEGKHRVRACPGRGCFCGVGVAEECLDLVLEGEYRVGVGLDEVGVDCGAAVCKVVGVQEGCIVLYGQVVDPVGPVAGGPARVGRVSEGVGGVRSFEGCVEACDMLAG